MRLIILFLDFALSSSVYRKNNIGINDNHHNIYGFWQRIVQHNKFSTIPIRCAILATNIIQTRRERIAFEMIFFSVMTDRQTDDYDNKINSVRRRGNK